MQIKGMLDEKTDVAVFVLAYNHEQWIQKNIESILKQKIDFSMKIYIHDDCSTDNTKCLIEKAYEMHPDIIVPIYEDTNQYSQGISISKMIVPLINCDFVALCEGDDFWIDENKLQMQYDYMKVHRDCSYCFGNAVLVDVNSNPLRKFYSRYSWKDKKISKKLKSSPGAVFSTEELILLDFTPTASVMYRHNIWNILKEYEDTFDLALRLASTEVGDSYYINKVLSAYRVGNNDSAHGKASASVENYMKNYYERHRNTCLEFDKRTAYKFTEIIDRELKRKLLQVYMQFLMIDEMRNQEAYSDLKAVAKANCYFKKYAMPLHSSIRNCRNILYKIAENMIFAKSPHRKEMEK